MLLTSIRSKTTGWISGISEEIRETETRCQGHFLKRGHYHQQGHESVGFHLCIAGRAAALVLPWNIRFESVRASLALSSQTDEA